MGFVKVKVTRPAKVQKEFKGCIYLGVPKSKSTLVKGKQTKPRTEFTNADILFVLEHGSPAEGKNLVPRPLLNAALKLHQQELNEALYRSLPVIFGGTEAEVDKYFETLALKIQGWVQMFMLKEGQQLWEPSIRVLKARAKGKEAKTMIDTGSLRQSIIAFYSKDGSKDV